jgi:hypothetical protein
VPRLLIFVLAILATLPLRTAEADGLIVYGSGFAFAVSEPPGWIGDIKGAAAFGANIIFYQRGETPAHASAVVRVLVADKVDENTVTDLESDERDYRQRYPKVIFKDIAVSHASYAVYPKLFCVPGEFYEYVTYLNPGPRLHFLLSVSMNTGKESANSEDWKTYNSIVRSLIFTTDRPTTTH